jgi:hypothetical protein
MKTPREILFERHRAAEAKLDVVRERALAELGNKGADIPVRTNFQGAAQTESSLLSSWRNFLLSIRWQVAGLSAAWLVVLLLSIDHSAATASAGKQIPSAQQLMAAVHENRRQVRELTGAAAVEISSSQLGPHSSLRGPHAPREQSHVILDEQGWASTKSFYSV